MGRGKNRESAMTAAPMPRKSRRAVIEAAVAGELFEKLEERVLFSAFLFATSFDGFRPTGNASLEDANYYAPVVGGGGSTGQVLLSSSAAPVNGGGSLVPAATLEASLGLPSGTLTGAGAAYASALVAPGFFSGTGSASTVTFDADFLTNDQASSGGTGQADFAIAYLQNSSGAIVQTDTLGQVGSATPALNPTTAVGTLNQLSTGFATETAAGGTQFTLNVPATGNFTVGFVVANVNAQALGASGVLLSNVSFPAAFNNFYDFGTAVSPVANGYTSVTASNLYSAGAGEGFTSGTIANVKGYDTTNTTFTNPDPALNQDFAYTYNGNFEVSGLSNGLYDVTLNMGDARGYTYNNYVVFAGTGNPSADMITGGATPLASQTFVVSVSNGTLTAEFGPVPYGLGSNNTSSYAVLDGMSIVPDLTHFLVTGSTPASGGTVSGAFSTIPITFNHSLNFTNDLTASDYTLTNTSSNATVTPSSVTETNAQSLTLNFASPITAGSYSLSFNNAVQDTAGNSLTAGMNDPITFTETAAFSPLNYDMGTAVSPVESGYTQVTQSSAYSASVGYGWASTAGLASYNTGIANSNPALSTLTEDFVYTQGGGSATFEVNVPNGNYDVTVILGDARGYSYASNVYFQGSTTPTDNIATGNSNPSIVSQTYFVTVSGGLLKVGFTGTNNSDVVIDGLMFVADTSPFGVISSTPASGGSVAVPFTQIAVNFNRPLNSTTDLSPNDYPLSSGGTTVYPTSVVESLGAQTVTLTYAVLTQAASYSLDVSSVTDAAGDSAVQSGTPITFTATGTIPTAPTKFNFQTSASPLAAGWTQIPANTTFSAALGYGYVLGGSQGTGGIADYDTGNTSFSIASVPTAVTRAFNYWATGTNTFGVLVANGTYSVTMIIGDPRNFFYSAQVYMQGASLGAAGLINTGVGSGNAAEVSETFSVVVTNGELEVGLGSVKNDAVLDGLSFVKTA